jgi:hypothetical protein
VYAPTVFEQVLLAERLLPQAVEIAHSFTSMHDAVRPLPDDWKPVPHEHE